jgi:HEAT repeat protein
MPESAEPFQELIESLRVEDVVERAGARRYLITIGAPAVPALTVLLHDPQQHVRWEAAKVLEGIADPSAAPALVEALADQDDDVSWVAAAALAAIGARGLKPLLERLACKPHPGQPRSEALYRGAHHVLHQLSARTDDRRFDRLQESLGEESPELSVPLAAEELLRRIQS